MIDYEQIKADCLLMVESAIEVAKEDRFNWETWFEDEENGYIWESFESYLAKECGTTACIAGNALTIPSLMERGLKLDLITDDIPSEGFSRVLYGDGRAQKLFETIFHKEILLPSLGYEYDTTDLQALHYLKEAILSKGFVEDLVKVYP